MINEKDAMSRGNERIELTKDHDGADSGGADLADDRVDRERQCRGQERLRRLS